MFAFFNNVPENGRALKIGNSPPLIAAPTADQQQELAKLETQLATAEIRLRDLEPRIAADQSHLRISERPSYSNRPQRCQAI